MRHKNVCTVLTVTLVMALTVIISTDLARAAEADLEELAQKLANPVASLISVPFQNNYDRKIGLFDDGNRFTTNIQPVIPFVLNDKWNLITRTILPVIRQDDIYPGAGRQAGLGDTVQTLYLSPRPGPSGLIWGAGPVLLYRTATNRLLGTKKWGVGPSAVLLKQTGPWTYGGLVNHIWSYAGSDSRSKISSTFLNPFVSRVFPGGLTVGAQLEHTLDHKGAQDTGQCMVFVSKVTKIGDQMCSFTLGPRYWYKDSSSSPEGLGFRFTAVLLFPR